MVDDDRAALDEMRRQMRTLLGAEPIPDATLAAYLAQLRGFDATIAAAASTLAPEDEPADYLAFLDAAPNGPEPMS